MSYRLPVPAHPITDLDFSMMLRFQDVEHGHPASRISSDGAHPQRAPQPRTGDTGGEWGGLAGETRHDTRFSSLILQAASSILQS